MRQEALHKIRQERDPLRHSVSKGVAQARQELAAMKEQHARALEEERAAIARMARSMKVCASL